ncbi:hypothetical protein F4805DRAFT_313021 [Annulohypoxylon moriforme]|nr:hypothetical protein F4805DRAFT_313021 [Annulohypoxylon moriforme]
MSFSRFRVNDYKDERHHPYGYNHTRYESYKPNEDRGQSRDYNNNSERDRVRDPEQGRQDSTDMRDPRESKGPPRSPHPYKKGNMSSPKPLHIDTRVGDGPRRSSSSARSATSAFSVAPTEPAADRTRRSNANTLPSSATTPLIPKAKDPNVQDVFDAAYKWNMILEDRALLKLRENKLLGEDQRRQAEISKIGGKVDEYAPYLEFKQRFETSGKAERDDVFKQLANLDEQYAENLEKLVCAISSRAPVNPQAAVQTASLSKLEAEFEKFQKQASEGQKQMAEAQAQIQKLSNDQEKSAEDFVALNQDFAELKSKHTTLEFDYAALKSENSELKQKVADLNSTKDSVKRVQDDVDKLSQEFLSIKTKLDGMESKVHDLVEKVEDLDMETYNDILGAWVDHDFKKKVPDHGKFIAELQQSLQSFRESAMSRLDKSETLAQETGAAVQVLEKARQATPHATNQATGDIKAFVEEKVEEKFNSLNEVMQKVVADSGDVCAEMVDEVRLRIDNVQTTVNTLSLARVPSKDPDTVRQIDALQQIMHQQGQNLRSFESRIESIEGQRLVNRIDRVVLHLAELENKVESNHNHGAGATNALIEIVRPEVDDAKKRLDALELSIRVLDSQWSNLSSKQMAERILQQLDPYGQRNDARVAGVENEIIQLRNVLYNVEQKLAGLFKDKKLADIVRLSPVDGKRHASSESPSEELMTKKRKLGSNGQFAPQQYRSSSNGI